MEVSRALKLFRMFCIMLAETKFPTASFLHQCFGLEEGVISEGTPGQLLSPEEVVAARSLEEEGNLEWTSGRLFSFLNSSC